MKKFFIIASLAFFGMTQAQVTFKPGLRAGANFSHFTKGDNYNSYYYDSNGNYVSNPNGTKFSSKTDVYVGFYGALHLTKYYTLQPEIDYSRQGSVYKISGVADERIDVSYLSIAIANKFTFNDKFNVHLGPTIEFVVENSDNINPDNEVDFAFFIGAGYNFTKNFGIEARVKKGIIPVLDGYNNGNSNDNSYHTNVVFSVGATYTFDLK